MNKKVFLLLIITFLMVKVFASEIVLTPLVSYDSFGNKIDMDENPAEAIYKSLEQHWFEGMIKFSYLSETQTGVVYTLMDANVICVSEKKDCIFYGYVQKNEGNWFANVKLYDASKKKVIREFYSSDDIDHYQRFLDHLTSNIIDGLMSITGLSKDELLDKNMRPTELKIPVSGFYWTPVDGDWNKVIMGVAGAKLGFEFFPSQKQVLFSSNLLDFSIMLKFEYNYGKNPNSSYPLTLNTVKVGLPVIFHIHTDTKNTLYTGFGINYGIEMLNYIPKYEEEKYLYQNIISGEFTAGYEFNISRFLNMFSELAVDIHFGQGGFITVKPTLGLSLNVFKGSK